MWFYLSLRLIIFSWACPQAVPFQLFFYFFLKKETLRTYFPWGFNKSSLPVALVTHTAKRKLNCLLTYLLWFGSEPLLLSLLPKSDLHRQYFVGGDFTGNPEPRIGEMSCVPYLWWLGTHYWIHTFKVTADVLILW